jgi:LCP family protein required for cell wall assembly
VAGKPAGLSLTAGAGKYKLNSGQKITIGLLTLVACVLLGALGYFGFQTYGFYARQPLGPALSFPSVTPWSLPPTWTASPPAAGTPTLASGQPSATGAPALVAVAGTPDLTPRCNGPAVMNILAVGSDQRGDSYLYGLGDVIRLVRVDFVTPKVTVLEFPRDLWVEIPDIADDLNGQDHERLNQAYLYGNQGFGYTDDPAQGPGLLARTLGLNFGVQLDHYIGVNMRTFVKIVDAVGGIEVDLDDTIDGRTASDRASRLLFLEGHHVLNGEQALTLARIRIDGVFSRADNQDLVLCALREKLTRPEVVTQIPQLIASFQDNIQTDLSAEQISQLACLGTQLPPGNIVFASFPEELFEQDRTYDPVFKKEVFTWNVDYNILRDYVARFQLGLWPDITTDVSGPDEEEPILCQ